MKGSSVNQSSPKFRPYLTLEQMERIHELILSNTPRTVPLTVLDQSIFDALNLMILKARNNITKPSFIPLAAKLGIPAPELKEPDPEESRYMNGQMSPEEAKAYEAKLMERINHGTS